MNVLEIRESRKKLGFMQVELVKKLGVLVKIILNYENGEVIFELKIDLLYSILSNNIFNELVVEYYNLNVFCEKLLEL